MFDCKSYFPVFKFSFACRIIKQKAACGTGSDTACSCRTDNGYARLKEKNGQRGAGVMKLTRLTERIWYYPMEKERDRPILGYIRGDRWSMAVDAGHSEAHTAEFYAALTDAGLPLPRLTVLTHWHWDHSFGLHAVSGLSLANSQTNRYLRNFRDRIAREGPEVFFALHESIRLEYGEGRPVKIVPADMEFTGEIKLDAGGCPVRVFQAAAPHTDDSTLIEVPGERVLFLGDASGGVFPTWEKDPELNRRLVETVSASDAHWYLDSHWIPVTKEEMIADMLSDET